MIRYSLEYLKELAEKRNGSCLSKTYKNPHTKYKWKCGKCNHKWEATLVIVQGTKNRKPSWCPKCSGRIIDLKRLREEASEVNLKVLFNKYDKDKKYPYKCKKCNHEFLTRTTQVRRGHGCPECAKLKRAETRKENTCDIKTIQKYAKNKGGRCLEEKYLGVDTKHWFECEFGHQWQTSIYSLLKVGTWCRECNGRLKPENLKNELNKLAQNREGKLLSKDITIKSRKYEFLCNLGHEFQINYFKLKAGQWCSMCSEGLYERISREAVQQFFKAKFTKQYPKWLKSKNDTQLELDGYNKKLKIAFEHQGIYHYGHKQYKNINFKKVQQRDQTKRELCKKNKIKLIEIPELTTRLKIEDLAEYLINECIRLNIKIPKHVKNEGFKFNFDKCYIAVDIIKEHQQKIKSRGLEILSKSYLGSENNHKYKCHKCGDVFETRFYGVDKGADCRKCSYKTIQKKRLDSGANKSFEKIFKESKKFGGLLLIDEREYQNTNQKNPYLCLKCGNIFETSFKLYNNSYKRSKNKYGCNECRGVEEIKIKSKYFYVESKISEQIHELKKYAINKNGKCLSDIYLGDRGHHYEWKCGKCNKEWSASWGNVKRGSWCPSCSAKKRGREKIVDVNELVTSKGGKYLGDLKKYNKVYRRIDCGKGHIFEISTANLNSGKWCGECYRARRR